MNLTTSKIHNEKVSNKRINDIIMLTEEYPSGRRGQFRKLLGGASLARVQIPVLPPKMKQKNLATIALGFIFNLRLIIQVV